jgi:cytidylate kinase
MYRALTLDILRQGVSPEAEALVVKRLETLDLRLQEGRIWLAGEDVGEASRANEVSVRMGPICAMPTVRAWMVALQRRLGSLESTVLDGRDIGTVVFPAARFKFFLVADLEERARRRQRELAAVGQPVELALLAEELRRRDESDAARSTGPLTKAADAVELDTTRLGLQEQAELILGLIRAGLERGGEPS